jgi:CRISPR-associated protein Cmr6
MSEPSLIPLPDVSARRYAALTARPRALVHPTYALLKLVRWHEGWSLDAPKSADPRSPGVKLAAYRGGLAALVNDERRRLAEQVRLRRASWLAPLERASRARRLVLTAKSDVVVWLVSAGPLELGLAVHHVYGFPFLPGTSLKGLARAHSEQPDAIYGTPDVAAAVTILDGFPLQGWEVQRDVMTPHFRSWYGEKRDAVPDDTDDPIPIPFLSIAAGSRFEVVLLARGPASTGETDRVIDDLRRGLDEVGLGAKTAAGYGVFTMEVDAFPDDLQEASPVTMTAAPSNLPGTAGARPKRPPAARLPAVEGRLEALRALRPGAVGQIAPFVEWCLALPEGPDQREAARAIVDNLGEKDARRRAKNNAQLARVVEIAEQQR